MYIVESQNENNLLQQTLFHVFHFLMVCNKIFSYCDHLAGSKTRNVGYTALRWLPRDNLPE